MTDPAAGRIVLLNGASSSGKTTLVKALQARLPGLWLEMGIDRLTYALPGRVDGEPTWPLLFRYVHAGAADGPFAIETTALGRRFVSAVHHGAATLAGLGFNTIVDHVLLEPSWLDECRTLWAPYRPVFIGVRCPLVVLVERERERKDRTIGQAEAQFGVVHRAGGYDLEVDTSVLSAEEAATRIERFLA